MKVKSLAAVLAATLGISFSSTSHAIVCLVPHPACAVVMGAGVVVAIIGSMQKTEMAGLAVSGYKVAEGDSDKISAIVTDLRATGENIKMLNYAQYSNGYKDLARRVQKGKIKGNLSAESLYNWDPKLFAQLDRIEVAIMKTYGAEMIAKTYGPRTLEDNSMNWNRYALLALDAQALYNNFWVVK